MRTCLGFFYTVFSFNCALPSPGQRQIEFAKMTVVDLISQAMLSGQKHHQAKKLNPKQGVAGAAVVQPAASTQPACVFQRVSWTPGVVQWRRAPKKPIADKCRVM